MKKEGIQTRNRKLSSKSKKKKGGMGAGSCLPLGGHHHHHLGDLMKPLDHNHKSAFPGAFPGAMGEFFFYFGDNTTQVEAREAERFKISQPFPNLNYLK